MKRGKTALTPVIITSILSSSLSQNSRSFADFYFHVPVQCGHKYRARHCALSFANWFVFSFWIFFFIIRKYFSYETVFFRKLSFVLTDNICLFFRTKLLLYIFQNSRLFSSKVMLLLLWEFSYDFWKFFLVRTVLFLVVRKVYFRVQFMLCLQRGNGLTIWSCRICGHFIC
jgi:hypothetical protein